MKTCRCCGESKPLSEFHLKRANPDGYRNDCKACAAVKCRDYVQRNPGVRKAAKRRWRQANPDRARQQAQQWHASNPEASKRYYRTEYEKHYGDLAAKWAARRALCKEATPVWADLAKIKTVYREAAAMRKAGLDVHVDHVYPLRGSLVCGLHVHNNLQIISASENLEKGNRLPASVN